MQTSLVAARRGYSCGVKAPRCGRSFCGGAHTLGCSGLWPVGSVLVVLGLSTSEASSWPRDRIRISCIGRQILYH